LQKRISTTTALAAPNKPGPTGITSSSTRRKRLLKILVICPDEQVIEQLDQILADRDDVALQHIFKENPKPIELDRHLHLHSPQAILVSSDGDDRTVGLIDYLTKKYPGLPVVVLHKDTCLGAGSLVPYMRAGAREVISEPLNERDVCAVVDRLCALPAHDAIPRAGKIMCFLPSKPGVGASTIAINTAAALAREGSKVLLVDGDLTSGMIRFTLKLHNQNSIRDAAQRIFDLDEFLWPQLITEVAEGLDVLHAGKVTTACSFDSEALLTLMDFWRATYDVVCFDFSGNLEPFSIEVMRYADRIFLVSTSEVSSLHLLVEKMQFLRASEMIDRVQIVQNRKASNEDLSKRQIEQLIGMPVCKVFRNNYSEASTAIKAGRPIRANSALGAEFKAFAAELCGKPVPNRKYFTQLVVFARKAGVLRAPQPTDTAPASTRPLVTFRPILALPEPAPRALVLYRDSTHAVAK
jgi:Flp pilus assembly CpaE family ATPase